MKKIIDLSLETRKNIYRYCVTENRSMVRTSVMLELPVTLVREYLFLVFSDENEKLKLLPKVTNTFIKQPKKPIIKVRSYYKDLTEEYMINSGRLFTPNYTELSIDSKSNIECDRRSFTEILRSAICYTHDNDSYFLVKKEEVNKINSIKTDDSAKKT